MARIKNTGLKANSHVELEIITNAKDKLTFNTVVETNLHDDEFVVFAPMENGRIYNLHTNQKINMNFIKHTDESTTMPCFIRTKVTKRDLHDGIAVVYLKKISDIYKLQRRDYFRMPITEIISVIEDGNEFTILTKDISAGGLRGIVERRLRINDILNLDMSFIKEDLWVQAKVVRIEKIEDSIKDYDVRLSFENIKNSEQKKIIQYLFKKQGEYINRILNHGDGGSISIDTKHFNELHDAYYKSRTLQIYRLILSSQYFLCLIGFGTFITARPELRFGIVKFFNLSTRYNWSTEKLYASIIIFSIQFILSIIGYSINLKKIKLLDNKISKMLIFSFFFSLIFLIISSVLYYQGIVE